MKVENIKEVEKELIRFKKKLYELKESQPLNGRAHTESSKETASLKRASMDLTRSLSKMRQDTW